MLAKVRSAAVNGIEAYPVEVEVNAGYGDTLIVIVGLPDAAVKEARDRVLTALGNSGYSYTFGRITINLAPADVKKEGPSFDLPIAIGMLAAAEQMESDQLGKYLIVGELALDGAVRPVKGVLPIAIRARQEGLSGVIVPAANAAEAAVVSGLNVIPVRNLREAEGVLEGVLGSHLNIRHLPFYFLKFTSQTCIFCNALTKSTHRRTHISESSPRKWKRSVSSRKIFARSLPRAVA